MNYISSYPYSTLFYILILLSGLLFAFLAQTTKSRRLQQFFVILIIFTLALPSGIRDSSVGKDTWAYIRLIESASIGYSGVLFYTHFEPGFQLLVKTLVSLVKVPQYVILVISFITNVLIVRTLWFFKNKISFSLSVFLFYTMYYFETYNIMRQWLAIAIVFYAIRYLLDVKYLKFLCFVILASLIHGAALVCFIFVPIHMLVLRKIQLKYKILMMTLLMLFAVFPNYLLNNLGIASIIEKYNLYYIQTASQEIDFGFYFLVRLAIIIFFLYLLNKNIFNEKIFAKSIIALSFLGTFLSMLGYIYPFAGRLGTYASVYEIILFSMIGKRTHFSFMVKIAFVILGCYFLYSGLKNSSQGHMPYSLFF